MNARRRILAASLAAASLALLGSQVHAQTPKVLKISHQFPGGTRRYLSEDWMFCQRWLDIGGKVYGDAGIVLKHIGSAVYPLQTQCVEAGLTT